MEPTSEPVTSGPRLTERRAWIVLAAGLATLVAGIALIVVSQVGGGSGNAAPAPAAVPGADETAALLDGIPQSGLRLGNPSAPVTLVEWADLQCPFCREFATAAFPALVRDYVRTGKVQIVFRGLAFLGPDSTKALQVALAAGIQDRLWNVVDLLYRNQGIENSGWATDELLHRITGAVDSLDETKVFADRGSGGVLGAISEASKAGRHRESDGHADVRPRPDGRKAVPPAEHLEPHRGGVQAGDRAAPRPAGSRAPSTCRVSARRRQERAAAGRPLGHPASELDDLRVAELLEHGDGASARVAVARSRPRAASRWTAARPAGRRARRPRWRDPSPGSTRHQGRGRSTSPCRAPRPPPRTRPARPADAAPPSSRRLRSPRGAAPRPRRRP